jgi:hypothetical protein
VEVQPHIDSRQLFPEVLKAQQNALDVSLDMVNDVEKNAFEVVYVKGYPSLAAFIASDRDKSTAIYRRFDRLSARNLLYLQSELQELEERQDAFDAEDLHGGLQEKKSARNWQALKKKAKQQNNEREKKRLDLVFEIRDKLKEYSM